MMGGRNGRVWDGAVHRADQGKGNTSEGWYHWFNSVERLEDCGLVALNCGWVALNCGWVALNGVPSWCFPWGVVVWLWSALHRNHPFPDGGTDLYLGLFDLTWPGPTTWGGVPSPSNADDRSHGGVGLSGGLLGAHEAADGGAVRIAVPFVAAVCRRPHPPFGSAQVPKGLN